MKNKHLWLFILPMLLTLSGCNKKESPKVKIITSITGEQSETVYFPYTFDLNDYKTFTTEENKNILEMGLLFCMNISLDSAVAFKGDKVTPDYKNFTSFYKHLGLDDFQASYVGVDKEYDVDDQTFINLAHKKVDDVDVCFITLQDSGGSSHYWSSNFDVGFDGSEYYSKTGDHPEWENKDNHKGFDITAERSLLTIKDYISSKLDKNSPQIFYVFGHSRGGALANILSAKMIDLDYKVISYGYASPATTTSKNVADAKYDSIHNYICEDDMITQILQKSWGFDRYGKTVSFALKDYKKSFEKINNATLPDGNASAIITAFSKLTDSRQGIYTIDDRFEVLKSDPLDKDDADALLNSYTSKFVDDYAPLANLMSCNLTPVEEDKYIVSIYMAPSFYTSFIGVLLGRGGFTSTANLVKEALPFTDFFSALGKVTGLSLLSIAGINPRVIVYAHYFYAYTAYINNI